MSSEEEGSSGEEGLGFARGDEDADADLIGGEFLPQGQRRMSKAEQIYGYDEGLDEGFASGARRKRKRKGVLEGASAPKAMVWVQPVSSGAATKAKEEPKKEDDAEETKRLQKLLNEMKQEKDQDWFRRQLLNQSAATAPESKPEEPAQEPKPSQNEISAPKPLKPIVKNLGAWEKNTKGFGRKYLEKFGFKGGGLGANESGVTRHVEVVVRPNGLGLGFGEFEEASSKQVNKQTAAEWLGKPIEELEKKEKKKSAVELDAEEGNWRKSKKEKPRERKVISAAELLQGDNSGPQVIIDMRGPQTRVVTDLTTLNDVEVTEADKLLGRELLYNVNLMADMAQKDAMAQRNRLRDEQEHMEKLKEQARILQSNLGKDRARVERLDKIAAILQSIHDKLLDDPGSVHVKHVKDAFISLRRHFNDEYLMLGIDRLVPSILRRVVEAHLQGWRPFENPELVSSLFAGWKMSLDEIHPSGTDEDSSSSHQGQLILDSLVEQLVLPIVWRSNWNPREPEPCVQVIQALQLVVSDSVVATLVDTHIMPRIQTEVDKWMPQRDESIHTWLHPWLPVLKAKLSVVYSTVRRKISSALKKWQPSQAWALETLTPWVGVFAKESMDNLLVRDVVPELARELRARFRIDPGHQDIEPFNAVMLWCRVVPELHFVSIWEGEFFPKWLTVLHSWLSSADANPEEVLAWYQGWQSQFPDELLDSLNNRLRRHFHTAMEMIETFLEGAVVAAPFTSEALETMSYHSVLGYLQGERRDQTEQAKVDAAKKRQKATEVSFKEVVEAFAEANNVTLLPKPGRAPRGQQMYSFGGVGMYIDKDVVFAQTQKGQAPELWSPMSLEELLERANA